MRDNIKISVVTPSFNQGEFIEETILSVLHQDYPDFEHLIIDGCSTDNTLSILKKYLHINWSSCPDKGQSDALNKGFLKSSGDWILWLNSDDILLPNAIKHFLESVDKFNDINVVHGYVQFFENSTRDIFKRQYFTNLNKNRSIFRVLTHPSSGTFFRRDFLVKNLLDINYHYMMDAEWYLRCSYKINLLIVNQFLVGFRVSDFNKTSVQIRTGLLNPQQEKEYNMLYNLYTEPYLAKYPQYFRRYVFKFLECYFRTTYRLSKIFFYINDIIKYGKC